MGHKLLKEKLQNEFSNVNMALKKCFSTGSLARMKEITDFNDVPQEEETQPLSEVEQEMQQKASLAAISGESTAKGSKVKNTPTPAAGDPDTYPEFDPADPAKNKVTPDVAALTMN